MLHFHVSDIRPDAIISTGVIQPFPIQRQDPDQVARATVKSFTQEFRPSGPQTRPEMQPEEIAKTAERVATAMRAGRRMPAGTDARLMQAAKYIMEGKPFVIRSAGRAAVIRARGPSSWEALYAQSPMHYAMRR